MSLFFFHCKRFLAVLLLSAAGTGCRKFLQIPAPDNGLNAAVIFSGDQNATDAMIGVYSRAMTTPATLLNGGMSIFPSLSSDELSGNNLAAGIAAFSADTLTPANFYITTQYASAYNCIIDANAILQNLAHSTAISDTVRQRLTGEAECMRALNYFCLVNLFGGVPLEITTNYAINDVSPRSSVDDIYLQIVQDLEDARHQLPAAYATGLSDPDDRARPNKWAATALLARVYLYRQDWTDAAAAASAVIDSGLYQLESPDNVFRVASQEAIWQLQPVGTVFNTVEGNWFLPVTDPSSLPAYVLRSGLQQAFESGDLRRQHWTGTKTVRGVAYVYPFKYKVKTGGYPYTEYEMVLRLAEQYLIRAEARAELGDPADLAGAVSDLNIIRSRAGLGGLDPSLSQSQVLAAVTRERRVEFFAEWGHRWLDLKRTGQADTVLEKDNPQWRPMAALYPIPSIDLARNPALAQNAGY